MPNENPKLSAYLQLVQAAETRECWQTADGQIIRGIAARLVSAQFAALDAGLTAAEMRAAVQIGEQRSQPQSELPSDFNPFEPSYTLAYWASVYREIEAFWERRYDPDATEDW